MLADATNSVANIYEETLDPTDRFQIAMNRLKLAGYAVGSTLLEMLVPVIEKVSNAIQKAADWWNGLSDAQKIHIITVAAVVAVIGPCIMVIGKLVSGIGGLTSGIGKALQFLPKLSSAVSGIVKFAPPLGIKRTPEPRKIGSGVLSI